MNPEIIAKNSYISVGCKKMLPLVKLIHGISATKASHLLSFSKIACAKDIADLLHSAINNAIHNFSVQDVSSLYVKEVRLGRAKFLKRFHARARGRGNRILKHGSTLSVILSVINN